MTIKDLYDWAVKNNAEDYEIKIKYRDEGGCYCGTDTLYSEDIENDYQRKEIIL